MKPDGSTPAHGRTVALFAGLTTVAFTGLACSAEPELDGWVTERTDSGSVEIVSHSGPDDVLETREALRVGLVDGAPEYLFDRIQDVEVASDGSIWVVDAGPSARRFSGDGTFLNGAGAEGQGPGESAEGWGLVWTASETVVLLDYGGSLQSFDWDGEYVGRRTAISPDFGITSPLVELGDGWLFNERDQPTDRSPTVPTERWEIRHGSILEAGTDSIFTLPGLPRTVRDIRSDGRISWGGGSFFDGVPDLGVDGSGRVFYSDGLDYAVSVFGPDGTLERSVRRQVEAIPFDPDWMPAIEQGIVEGWLEQMGQRPPEERLREGVAGAQPDGPSPRLPALDRIFVSRDGSFWVRRGDRHPDPAARAVAAVMGYAEWYWPEAWRADWWYDLYDPTGEYLGSAQVPSTYTPFSVDGRRMYGVARDELDVEFVSVLEAGSRER